MQSQMQALPQIQIQGQMPPLPQAQIQARPQAQVQPQTQADGKPAALPIATPAQVTRASKTAHKFEASFLEVMMGQMFDTVHDNAFSGGEGEDAFKSFLTNAMADAMAKRGGVGMSKQLTHELLKMQGLSEGGAHP